MNHFQPATLPISPAPAAAAACVRPMQPLIPFSASLCQHSSTLTLCAHRFLCCAGFGQSRFLSELGTLCRGQTTTTICKVCPSSLAPPYSTLRDSEQSFAHLFDPLLLQTRARAFTVPNRLEPATFHQRTPLQRPTILMLVPPCPPFRTSQVAGSTRFSKRSQCSRNDLSKCPHAACHAA